MSAPFPEATPFVPPLVGDGSPIQRGPGLKDLPIPGEPSTNFAEAMATAAEIRPPDTYGSRSVFTDAIIGAATLRGVTNAHDRFRVLADARLDYRRDAGRERALGAQAPDDLDDLQDFLIRQTATNVLPTTVATRVGDFMNAYNRPTASRGERFRKFFACAAQAGRVAVAASVTFPEMTRRAGRLIGTTLYRNPPETVADWLYGAPARPARAFQPADPAAGRPYDIPARPANAVRDPYRPEWAVNAMARNRALGIGAAILAAPATLVRYQRRRR